MERWQGKTALVTGASSGIGYATALRLSDAGMRVVACARRKDPLVALSAQATGEVIPRVCDLRDEAQITAMFADEADIDVLVNNAGLGHNASLLAGATDRWREMLDVNVLALCICTRLAVASMTRRKVEGHVVHISSMAAHRVPPESGVYAATKHAVKALTEALRQELRQTGSPVRVSSISPGFVETEFAAHYHQSEETAKKTYGRYPVIQSIEVADAVLYALTQPPHVQVHDILMRPTQQSY